MISMEQFCEKPVIVLAEISEYDELLPSAPKLQAAEIICIDFISELEIQGIYAEVAMEKQEWKSRIKEQVKQDSEHKPEAVFVGEILLLHIQSYMHCVRSISRCLCRQKRMDRS